MIDVFVSGIKKKKTLRSLPDDFVKVFVSDFFEKNPKIEKVLAEHPKPLKSKEFDILLKEARRRLHEVYGVFVLGRKDLKKLKEHLKVVKELDEEALQLHLEILKLHKSSAERLDFYPEVYEKIFSITGRPKTVLDLACGLNPLSFPWMGLEKVRYFAYELTKEDCRFIKEYFGMMGPFGLDGEAFDADLLRVRKFPEVDVCFLFKALDTLEDLERNYSEKLLKKIHAKFVVVSFPTMSIGGRNPIRQRGWFFRMMRKLGYSADTFELENEIFCIIRK